MPTSRHRCRRTERAVHVSVFATLLAAVPAQSIVQGPSSSQTPYLRPAAPNAGIVVDVTSIVTATDFVPTTGAPTTQYEFVGVPDGLGAYDNGDGTVTILAHHELASTAGALRRHGARGAFVSATIVDRATLAVVSSGDAIASVVDAAGVVHDAAHGNAVAFHRFCSGDLPAVSAFFDAGTGLGSTARFFLGGEEGNATGFVQATVLTGPEQGLSYTLPAFNPATSGSGINATGAYENLLANPFAQPLTIVAGNNDGGSGIVNNRVMVYVGTKQASGTEVEKAGLKNGQNWFVSVTGNPVEIVNTTTRATNITTGTRFSLSATGGTQFSRPEDGAWDPTSPRDYYFTTTDRLDTLTNTGFNQTIGATGTSQRGRSRLWRLRFDDIANPQLGGEVALLIDGDKNGIKVNMLDNMCVGSDGMVFLVEDPGNTTYIPKAWAYDSATDTLLPWLAFDQARWGELAVNGGTPGAIAPHTNDKEISGVVDVTHLFPHAVGETVLLIDAQDHSTNAAVADAVSVEGGQLLLVRVALRAHAEAFGVGCGLSLAVDPTAPPVLGATFAADIANVAPGMPTFMMVGLSNPAVDLGFVGLPGCLLYNDLVIEIGGGCVATGPGTARYTLAMPAPFTNAGVVGYLQAWSAAAGALVTSNGLAITLGL